MNFFEQQRKARRNSIILYFLFFVGAAAISYLNTYILGFASLIVFKKTFLFQQTNYQFNKVFFLNFLIFIFFIVFTKKNAESGVAIAKLLGGRMLKFPLQDPDEKKLFNIIEEISVASGLPTPFVFVLDGEDSINAFAAGIDRKSFSVAVTKGAITYLSRDELQAVIAHEYSHIVNEDMSMNAELTGVVSAFMMFMRIGKFLLNETGRSSRRSGVDILGVAFLIIGSIGFVIGRFIQSLFSKEREYLADAVSAQYTRNPMALAKALAKIKTYHGSMLVSSNSYDYAHIFFAEGVSGFFSTHPKIESRINALVPNLPLGSLVEEAKKEINSLDKKIEERKKELDPVGAVKVAPDYIQDVMSAKAALYAVLLKNQNQNVQSLYLGYLESYSKDLHLKTLAYIRNLQNHPANLAADLKKSFGILRTTNEQERAGLIQLMQQIFQADQRWTWLEGLMFELSQEILIRQSSTVNKKIAKYNRLQDIRESLIRVLFWAHNNGEGTDGIEAIQKKAIITRLASTVPVFVGMNPDFVTVPHFSPSVATVDFQNLYALNIELKAKVVQAMMTIHKSDKPLEPWEFESIRLMSLLLNIPEPLSLGREKPFLIS